MIIDNYFLKPPSQDSFVIIQNFQSKVCTFGLCDQMEYCMLTSEYINDVFTSYKDRRNIFNQLKNDLPRSSVYIDNIRCLDILKFHNYPSTTCCLCTQGVIAPILEYIISMLQLENRSCFDNLKSGLVINLNTDLMQIHVKKKMGLYRVDSDEYVFCNMLTIYLTIDMNYANSHARIVIS